MITADHLPSPALDVSGEDPSNSSEDEQGTDGNADRDTDDGTDGKPGVDAIVEGTIVTSAEWTAWTAAARTTELSREGCRFSGWCGNGWLGEFKSCI